MFSGIVHRLSQVKLLEPTSGGLRLALPAESETPVLGSSHALQGVCLTLSKVADGLLWFDISNASLEVTALGQLKPGDWINHEPALCLGDSLDGHLVSGHVDAVGEVCSITRLGDNYQLGCAFPAHLAPYIATKGSICIDGVSLTVNQVESTSFVVNIVPYTWAHTCFGRYQPGTMVHLEIDILARYVVNALRQSCATSTAPAGPLDG